MSTPMRIPMVDLVAQHAAIEQELLEAFAGVIASGRFVLGDAVAAFETELARHCGSRFAVSCNSGTDALGLALQAHDIGPGDAVLCTAFSFFATAATIVRAGATPIFVDIDPATLNLDIEQAIERIVSTPAMKAVVTVDLFGRLCEIGRLEDVARDRGIALIEDAAQSIGAIDAGGQRVGERAQAACLSFYPTKNLGALGDAGAIVTNDEALRERMTRLRVHGESSPGVYEELGVNSRMDALQAAALSVKLGHLDRWTKARRELALHYDALFAERGAAPATEPMASGGLALQTPPPAPSPARHTYHRYVVRVPEERRAGLIEALDRSGIASEIYYPRGLHRQPALRAYAPDAPLTQVDLAASECLALPLYPEMPLGHAECVVDVVTSHLQTRTARTALLPPPDR